MVLPVLSLHDEVIQRTTSFLPPKDATRLSRTCKAMHESLSLTTLSPTRVLCPMKVFYGEYHTGNCELPFIRIPVFSRRVHSVTLSFEWRDQGWGNRKGQFWIVGYPAHGKIDYTKRFFGGRLVYESDIAQHYSVRVRVTLHPVEGELYQMWFRVGGGGGHELRFDEISLSTLIFDTEEHSITQTYQMLVNVGVVSNNALDPTPRVNLELFMQRLVSLRHQLAQGETPDEDLLNMFEQFGVSIDQASLASIEDFLQAELLEQTEPAPLLEPVSSDGNTDRPQMALRGRPPFVPHRSREEFDSYLKTLHNSMMWGTLVLPVETN